MRRLAFALAFALGCGVDSVPPVDMPADMSVATDGLVILVRDFATGYPDLFGPDMATECIKCNALINPCPARGLYCDGRTGCCDSNPH